MVILFYQLKMKGLWQKAEVGSWFSMKIAIYIVYMTCFATKEHVMKLWNPSLLVLPSSGILANHYINFVRGYRGLHCWPPFNGEPTSAETQNPYYLRIAGALCDRVFGGFWSHTSVFMWYTGQLFCVTSCNVKTEASWKIWGFDICLKVFISAVK